MELTIFQTLYDNIQESTWLEGTAVLFGLLSVWFAKKENILVFPTGIISVLIYVYICLNVKLYADMAINAFYFVMSVYGWYKWSRKGLDDKVRPISGANRWEWIISIAGSAMLFFLIGYVLKNYTDSNVPYWDALTTAIFIIGMWLMAWKKIENWIFWIIGDLISIPLYAYKGLVLTSFQFTVFLILAISGYLEWRSKLKSLQHKPETRNP
jgi:nicotinamide mononucleotide transporter